MGRWPRTLRSLRFGIGVAAFLPAAALSLSPIVAQAHTPQALLVGTYNSIPGTYSTIQAAVNAAQPGDWILVGPGDYHERADYASSGADPAGVYITTAHLHIRGMNRNTVIVDGTKSTATGACSSNPGDQDLGPSNRGRNGIEVYGPSYKGFNADGVTIDNLTACNFLTSPGGDNGNEIWWNGGDGGGQVGMSEYAGEYLTGTSTYANSNDPNSSTTLGACCGVYNPSGSYGIFVSDSTHGFWQNDFASNMSDSAFYVGACQQVCDMVMDHDHGQTSALCLSSTNAGGSFVVQYTECDQNKTGLVNNSQNNDDYPSPQHGQCDVGVLSEPQTGVLGGTNCTVWRFNNLHDNNNPDVPGNGVGGLAGGGPVGTGLILAGSSDVTTYDNTITNNNSWGELIVDLPDQESGPANCQGGTDVNVSPAPEVCYYRAVGNVSLDNHFANNGSNGNPTNGDILLATLPNNPGNCLAGDTDPVNGAANTASTDPAAIEGNPLYAPTSDPGQADDKTCQHPNAGDMGVGAGEALCASQLVVACPTLADVICQLWPSNGGTCPAANSALSDLPGNYPRPDATFTLSLPNAQLTPTMPDPCAADLFGDVMPANAWCPSPGSALPDVRYAALPGIVGGGILAVWLIGGGRLRRRRAARIAG